MFRLSTIANANFGPHGPERLLVAVCFGYFDASGHPDEPNRRQFTVAGYVGLENRWNRFEKEWTAVLDKYGVPSFHANKMAQWGKPYDTWKLPDGERDIKKRIAFIRELAKAIKRHVYKAFSQSISLDDYDAVNGEYRLDELCKPYSLCAGQLMRNVSLWMRKVHPDDDILFVFEQGDADHGYPSDEPRGEGRGKENRVTGWVNLATCASDLTLD